jgi:hypothetical protein
MTKPYSCMKKITFYLLFLVSTDILFSCSNEKTDEMISESADKQNQIKISGGRGTSFDPYQVTIIVRGYNQSDSLMTEIYAKELNKETVKFSWLDNNSCKITFVQQDDSKRNMNVTFGQDGNSLREE